MAHMDFKSDKINNPSHHLFQFSTADSSVIFEETEENTVLKSPSIYEVIRNRRIQ